MATIEDMVEVVNNVFYCRFSSIVTDLLYRALREAERKGRCHNDYYMGEYCTCWKVGDYIITYPSGYMDFNADMLTEDMMDDLIIEEVL